VTDALLCDTSVLRNFAVLGWSAQLTTLSGGRIRAAHGVVGLDADEAGEIEGIREALHRLADEGPGSGLASRALAAAQGIDVLLSLRPSCLEVVVPTENEATVTGALTSSSERDRAWRRDALGLRARRLDTGEAVSIAITVERGWSLACDEADGRRAFAALCSGREASSTLDLVLGAVNLGVLGHNEAREGYEHLRNDEVHSFAGPEWPT
jgi:hypothetical protein